MGWRGWAGRSLSGAMFEHGVGVVEQRGQVLSRGVERGVGIV